MNTLFISFFMTFKSLVKTVYGTEASCALAIARITLGGVILPHGLQKAFGLFGGSGFEGAMGFLTGPAIGLPWIIALMVVLIETLGSLALIFGLSARKSAFFIAVVLVGAILTVHLPNGFFMQNGGFEYHLLGIGTALAIMVGGAGSYSLDRLIVKKFGK